jgi:hypothetical protein
MKFSTSLWQASWTKNQPMLKHKNRELCPKKFAHLNRFIHLSCISKLIMTSLELSCMNILSLIRSKTQWHDSKHFRGRFVVIDKDCSCLFMRSLLLDRAEFISYWSYPKFQYYCTCWSRQKYTCRSIIGIYR